MFFVLWKTSQTKHAENTCTHLSAEPKPPPPKKSPSVLSLGNAGPEISESPPAVFSLAPRLRRRFRGCVIYVHADVCVPVRTCVYRAGLFLFGSSGPPGSETWDDPPRGTRSSGGLPESLGLDVAEKLAVSATTCPPPFATRSQFRHGRRCRNHVMSAV